MTSKHISPEIAVAIAARDAAQKSLRERQQELNDLLAEECQYKVGQIVQHRGRSYKITRIGVRYDVARPYGVQALKGGGYGKAERELWEL